MNPGGFNHVIVVERQVQMGVKPLGDPIFVWQTFLPTVFCEMAVLRGREHFDQQTKQRFSEDVYHFRCHYHDIVGLDPKMRITDEDGQHYDIKSIRPDVEFREDAIVECTLQDAVIGPKPLLGFIDVAIPEGVANTPYSGFAIKADGGTAPYAFSITTGTLPVGLTLDAATGAIAGTPTASGIGSFTITVTDAARSVHALPPLSITVV